MARRVRPSLSEDTFLKHLFSPRKNPLPTGIRKRDVSYSKGRSKARVNAFNRMSVTNREALKQSGMREAYLRGETTLRDARTALRGTAVQKGYARPVTGTASPTAPAVAGSLDSIVTGHVVRELRKAGLHPNPQKLRKRIPHMTNAEKRRVEKMSAAEMRAYASDSDNMIEIDDEPVNPLWYHDK